MVSTLHCKCNQGVKVQVAQQRLWWSPDRYGILTTRHRPGVKMVGFEQTHLDGTPVGKIVIHAQDVRILKSLGFEDPYILRIIGSSNLLDVCTDKWIIS